MDILHPVLIAEEIDTLELKKQKQKNRIKLKLCYKLRMKPAHTSLDKISSNLLNLFDYILSNRLYKKQVSQISFNFEINFYVNTFNKTVINYKKLRTKFK